MYEGDNKTALASQEMICDALFRLLNEKSFASISISQICKEAQISRQTFYSLFKSKENVVLYQLKNKCNFSLDFLSEKDYLTLKDICHAYNIYIRDNFDFIKLLIDNNLSQVLYESFYHGLYSRKFFLPEYESMRKYIVIFMANGLVSITKTYITDKVSHDSHSIEKIMYPLFKGLYFF